MAHVWRGSVTYVLASLAILLCVATSSLASESQRRPGLHVQLVADRESVAPGKSFHAGLYFRLEKGWHI